MAQELKVAPSILACDFARMGEEIQHVIEAGADMIHVDVMDGHFTPNITIGPPVVASLRSICTIPMDVHLMITDPDDYVEAFAHAGADIIPFHLDAALHPLSLVDKIRDLGCQAGIVLNPGTSQDEIEFIVDSVDMVLVMTDSPRFGGDAFMPEMLEKIRLVRTMLDDRDLEVDGGINESTAAEVYDAGANILVAGNHIFKSDSYLEAIESLRHAAGAET